MLAGLEDIDELLALPTIELTWKEDISNSVYH